MMHRISSKNFGWVSLFSTTVVLSMLGQVCLAQDETSEARETKTVSISALVGSPPPGITLKEALESFPESVGFEYQHMQKVFTTTAKPFSVERALAQELNITIQSNDGLKHEDQENVQQVLMPVLKVGDVATIKSANDMAKWCGSGEAPALITFGIEDGEEPPVEGNYTGEIVLVFEPASK